MLAIAMIAVVAQIVGRELQEGDATVIAYGLKVPQFVITSIWFVLGTGYFADLVAKGTHGARQKIAAYSAINLAIMAGAFLVVAVLDKAQGDGRLAMNSDILRVLASSAPFLPLIVLTPFAEMTQRLLATSERHGSTLFITAAVVVAGLGLQAFALAARSTAVLAWSPVVAGLAGAVVAIVLLARLQLPTQSAEAT